MELVQLIPKNFFCWLFVNNLISIFFLFLVGRCQSFRTDHKIIIHIIIMGSTTGLFNDMQALELYIFHSIGQYQESTPLILRHLVNRAIWLCKLTWLAFLTINFDFVLLCFKQLSSTNFNIILDRMKSWGKTKEKWLVLQRHHTVKFDLGIHLDFSEVTRFEEFKFKKPFLTLICDECWKFLLFQNL